MRTESKVLEQNNRDMDQRLREIKQLFEKEQGEVNSLYSLFFFVAQPCWIIYAFCFVENNKKKNKMTIRPGLNFQLLQSTHFFLIYFNAVFG